VRQTPGVLTVINFCREEIRDLLNGVVSALLLDIVTHHFNISQIGTVLLSSLAGSLLKNRASGLDLLWRQIRGDRINSYDATLEIQ
jgi:hypothetical protein